MWFQSHIFYLISFYCSSKAFSNIYLYLMTKCHPVFVITYFQILVFTVRLVVLTSQEMAQCKCLSNLATAWLKWTPKSLYLCTRFVYSLKCNRLCVVMLTC